jgi:glutamate synthase (NADPH/NADH) small chain
MGKVTGFLEYGRVDPPKRLPLDRIRDYDEIRQSQDESAIKIQGARCMNCGVPFCSGGVLLNGMVSGCPLHNLIPEFNELVYKGQWHEAYRRLIRTNPFPEFTSRVCPAPCEGSCTEGYILEAVAISSLEYQIIEKAFAQGWVEAVQSLPSGKQVAIVGSGPAGLACAYYLNLVGHDVTVYERSDRAGGLLLYGIPNMKLDKRIVERRIDLLKRSGIKFILNTEVGKDVSAKSLATSYDALILCGGATQGRTLDVIGNDAKGIYPAVAFLQANTKNLLHKRGASRSLIDAQDKHVIVIGGGDTGTDCVATALRQGCASVVQFEILPSPSKERNIKSNPWPEWPRKLKTDYGQEEAIAVYGVDPRKYLIATKRIETDESGHVVGVQSIDVTWEKDADGHYFSKETAGSERSWKADVVLLAMGFAGPESLISDELQLLRDPRSNYKAEYGTFKTNLENVFTAGDMRRGQSLVVWAIQEGKLAAREVDRFLTGKTVLK